MIALSLQFWQLCSTIKCIFEKSELFYVGKHLDMVKRTITVVNVMVGYK